MKTEEEVFRRRLTMESFNEYPDVYGDTDWLAKWGVNETLKALKTELNEEKYQEWKTEYLAKEYEKQDPEEWKTIIYTTPGNGPYSETMRKGEDKEFIKQLLECVGVKMESPRKATEQEIKNQIGKLAIEKGEAVVYLRLISLTVNFWLK